MDNKSQKQKEREVKSCFRCQKSFRSNYIYCGKCLKNLDTRAVIKRRVEEDPEDKVVETRDKTTVYGRDIIQPYKEGRVNQKFIDRYGDGIYKNKPSQLDGQGKEKKRPEPSESGIQQV